MALGIGRGKYMQYVHLESLALCVTKTKLSDIVHAVNIFKNLLGFLLT